MDRRTKILVTAFSLLIAYALGEVVVYPRWIRPLLTIEQQLVGKQDEYDQLKTVEDEVRRGKEEYKGLVTRVGSFDIAKVETEIRDRLNRLIEKHQLQDANVSPSRPTKDRKTNIEKMLITVTATGNLESVVGLLKDASELPQVVRVSNPAIYPATGGKRERGPALMNVRVPIEVYVPPQHKLVAKIDFQELPPPELYVRHDDRDYSVIWGRRPFTEPVPIRLTAKGVNVEQGQQALLSVTVTGGDPDYRYKWDPPTRLSDANAERPTVDTSATFSETYTVTVTDASGETASENVQVTVREPKAPPPAVAEVKPSVQPRIVDNRWPERGQMQACMVLQYTAGAERFDELMVYNSRSRETKYYTVGNEFDGGDLVFVHPTGGVVRRSGQFFIYPIGSRLDGEMNADMVTATDYPELKQAIDRLREAEKLSAEAAAEAARTAAASAGSAEGVAAAKSEGPAEGNAPAAEGAPGAAQADVAGLVPNEAGGDVAPVPAQGALEVSQGTDGDAAGADEQASDKDKPKRAGGFRPGAKRNPPRPRDRKGK